MSQDNTPSQLSIKEAINKQHKNINQKNSKKGYFCVFCINLILSRGKRRFTPFFDIF